MDDDDDSNHTYETTITIAKKLRIYSSLTRNYIPKGSRNTSDLLQDVVSYTSTFTFTFTFLSQ